MIQLYADNTLAYDSRLSEYDLLELKVSVGINVGGTAEITMPPGHPAYSSFVNYRTVVTIYRDNILLFRGRALFSSDDFYNRRKITCEGERCFLQDGVMRPYIYQDSPSAIFTDVITTYNSQVEAFKQFVVGTITVVDANNYIRLETSSAEQASDTIDKLIERCGGYIIFTTNLMGQRVINWYSSLDYQSDQSIEFGENLLDFTREGSNTDLATVVIPYGAQDEATGNRITIESVNSGLDYIKDNDAVALRGTIAKAVYWDDVTLPSNLLTKAQQYLASHKLEITSLQLSAVDLSALDKNIDTFQVGDSVKVISTPHGVNAMFKLAERTYDLLNPSNDTVSLGKEQTSLTAADVADDKGKTSDLQRTEQSIRSDYTLNIAAAISATQQSLTSLIQQTSESIMSTVSENYTTNDILTASISTSMAQLSDRFEFLFSSLQTTVDANDSEARTHFATIESYIRFEDGNIILGEQNNQIVLRIENDKIVFLNDGAEIAYWQNRKFYAVDGEFINSLKLGRFAFNPRDNGNLSFRKVVN